MIDSLVLFKSELERKLKISKWSPTDSDIAYIAKKIATGEAQSRAEIVRLVLEVFPSTLWFSTEGVDNSDLKSLIQLPTLSANSK